MATLEKNVTDNDLDNEVLEMGLESTPSYDRIGQTVVHLPDFDGTIYAEDIGQLASQHHQSHLLGFEDVDDFLEKVKRRREDKEELSRGSEKANIIVEESEADISDINDVLVDSQRPEKIKGGFRDSAKEMYKRGNMIAIVTAGVDTAAKNILNGSQAKIIGANLFEDAGVIDAEYCGREEKPVRIRENVDLESYAPIAVGDSATDAEFLKESAEAGGQAIAIEEGAIEYATIDASDDVNYETLGVLQILLDELYTTGSSRQAQMRAEEFLQDKEYDLTEVDMAKNWNAMTLEAVSAYNEVRESYE
jgi:phosphoserine phosphatase